MKKTLLILTFLVISLQSIAQTTFPVQLTPQVIPPYPIYVSDYANTNFVQDKVRLQVVLNDITINTNEIRLKLYLQGEGIAAQSKDFVVGATPIFIEGGIPIQLGTSELAPYFEFQNLQGITPNTYGNALPEGVYQICFEAYDAMTNNVLSAKTCSTIVLFQNDPPFLNLPFNASGIQEQNPLNIVFQWTPRHINVSNVQYEFSLVEIWDNYIDPQAAFLSTPPIFQTTLTGTTLIYGPAFPQLLTGKKYAWNVRAFALDGAEEIGLFTNQGNSEIFWFTFQTPCDAPLFPEVEELSDHHAKLTWQGDSAHIDYTIKYREKNANSEWYELSTPREYITISDLKLETSYEYKIQGNCDYGSFGDTIIYEFTTLSEQASAYIGCNIEPDPVDLSNQDILQQLFVYDIIKAGDFPIVVTEIDEAVTPFTGKGFVVIPWLAFTRVKVEFNAIQVNTDMRLIAGEVKTTYDADWGSIENLDDVFDDVFGDNGNITEYDAGNLDINHVEVDENGNVVLVDENNIEHTIQVTLPVIITDQNDEQWAVDEDGNITELGPQAEGGTPTSGNTNGIASNGSVNLISSPDVSIVFNESGYYSTDVYPENVAGSSSLLNKYEVIPTANGGIYKVLYKAISNISGHETDLLQATATFSNGKTKDDIIFKTSEGTAVTTSWSGDTATLQLKKQFNYAKNEIIATVIPADSTQKYDVAGKTNLVHAEEQVVNVTIVPLNGASFTSADEALINEIYNPAGVTFNITEAPNLNIAPSDWNLVNSAQEILDIGDSDILANYTIEERAIYNYYKSERGIDDQMYYIFLATNIPTSKPQINGFMPLKRQYGFVFNQEYAAQIAAHELGHGVFGLKHYEEIGTEDYLMHNTYPSGTQFTHMDWEVMHAPGLQLYIFQGDEDGEQVTVSNMEYLDSFKNSDGTYTFISLSGKPITLPTTTTSITFSTGDDLNLSNCEDLFKIEPFGALKSFIIEGIDYSFCGSCNSDNFAGYFERGTSCANNSQYIDILSNQNNKNAIVGLPCISNNAIVFKVMLLYNYFENFDFPSISNNTYNGQGELKPYDFIIGDFNYVVDENIVYVPAQFNPVFDDDVKQFLQNEYCFCSEDDFTSIAYGFIYATQLQKNKEFFSCFNNGVPLFFYDENINSDKLHHVIVQDWENININGFNTLKSNINKFKTLSASFNNPSSLHDFLKKYVPEEISDSNANSYSLRFGTAYWETGIVLDKIQHISDNQLLKQHDDLFCLWESIPFTDRISAINTIADANTDELGNRYEEIVLYLVINASDETMMINKLKESNYGLFWKVWNVLDKPQRSILVSYLNQNLINATTRNAGKIVYETFIADCENSQTPCNLNDYKLLPLYRASALNRLSSAFDIENEQSTESFFYSLETTQYSENINIDLKVGPEFLQEDDNNYLSLFTHSGSETIFFENIAPFNPIVLLIKEDIKLNGEIILNKNQIATVPAIFLHWLDSSIDSEQNQIVFQIAADGLIVASIMVSGGATTPLLALDLAVFGTDFVFQIVNETSDSIDPEIQEAWESIYTIYNIANIPRAVMSAGSFAVNGSNKLFTFIENSTSANSFSKLIVKPQYLDDFLATFDDFSASERAIQIDKAIIDLDKFILAIKNTPALSSQALIPKSLYRNLIDLRLRLANTTFNVPLISAEIQASSQAFSPYLKIVNNNTAASTAVANVVYEVSATKPLLTNVRWLSDTQLTLQNTNVLGSINEVRYLVNGNIKTNQLQILQDKINVNQFYLDIIVPFGETIQDTHPNLWSKYNALSEERKTFFDADFYLARADIIDELEQISNYNQFDKFLEAWIPNRDSSSFRDMLPQGANAFKAWWYPKITVSSSTSDLLYNSQKAFEQSLNTSITNIENLPSYIRGEFWNYYRQRKWDKLEALSIDNDINLTIKTVSGVSMRTMWPPGGGGYNNLSPRVPAINEKFTRYGGDIGFTDDGLPILIGGYTSPGVATDFNFDQRALDIAENKYDYFYEIEILDNSIFTVYESTVIPWFNKGGNGQQALLKISDIAPSGHPKSWTQLAKEGKVKLKIINSPSGNNNFSNTIIYNVAELIEATKNHIKYGEVNIKIKDSQTGNIISETNRKTTDTPITVPETGVNIQVSVSGIHFENILASGLIEEISGTRTLVTTLQDGTQVYKSKIKIWIQEANNGTGIWKTINNEKTWWPSSWSENKVWSQISEAFNSKNLISGNKYIGVTTDGTNIELYLNELGKIKTAYIIP